MNKAKQTQRLYSNIMRIWNESEILVDRKSKFQGRCCALKSPDDVPTLLNELVQGNKSVSKASHMHMYAWRVGDVVAADANSNKKKTKSSKKHNAKEGNATSIKNIQQGCADCGEAAAGQRLLTLLERASVANVLVIVTRWYGGTPLGSARFRHISDVTSPSC